MFLRGPVNRVRRRGGAVGRVSVSEFAAVAQSVDEFLQEAHSQPAQAELDHEDEHPAVRTRRG